MERTELKAVLEALLFTSEAPLTLDQIRNAIGPNAAAEIKEVLAELKTDYEAAGRGLRIEEVAGGFRLYTRPEYSQWVRRLARTRQERRFSTPALETLAIVAYRQPITKAEIEMIRGVNSDGVLETLLERGLVKIRGRREGLGRPILYGTTQGFLEYFGLGSLKDLPEWGAASEKKEEALNKAEQTPKDAEQTQDEKDTQKEPVQQTSNPD